MKTRSIIAMTCVGLLAFAGMAIAHGTEKHGKTAMADAQMKKLHAMMPMFSLATAQMETALGKGDLALVASEGEKILTAVPDLKKSKPHRNIKQRKKYVELAGGLGTAVSTTVDLAKKGDFAGAKGAFKKVEEVCAACHATFRD